MNRVAAAVLLLALIGIVSCGDEAPVHTVEPLSAVEREAVGKYTIDLVHEVTDEQRRDLLSMRLLLRADRTFGWTRWVEDVEGRMTTTGTWRIDGGMLVTMTTGYHSVDDPGLPTMEMPEPEVWEGSYEDGAIRMWPHRPYLLRRVKP